MAIDLCTTVSCETDILCLDALLYSLHKFGDLESINLLVSVNSSEAECEESLRGMCAAHCTRSLYTDRFPRKIGDPAWQHGLSLNRLISKTTTDQVLFIDPDIIVTSRRLWAYCMEEIQGKFMVGTPYHDAQARIVWQGTFPNIWLAIVDGHILRQSGLDMRPGSKHLCPNGWMTDEELGEYWLSVGGQEAPPTEWALRGKPGGALRDTGWELAGYARKHNLKHCSLEYFAGGFSRKNRGKSLGHSIEQWGSQHGEATCVSIAKNLRGISPLEFCFRDSKEVCCLHLLHATTKPARAKAWIGIAKHIVDACYQMHDA